MNANELRIGNWVLFRDEEAIVLEIAKLVFLACDGKHRIAWYHNIKPIPLTPEILERYGFVNYDNSIYCYSLDLGSLIIRIDLLQKSTLILDADDEFNQFVRINHVENLHQLQNLVFTLTEKELTLPPDTNP